MKYLLLKLLTILLVYNCQYVKTIPNEKNYLTFANTIEEGSTIKTGDFMNCEIIKTNSEEFNKNDIHVFTQESAYYSAYIFYPASRYKKCFSFQVRTTASPHILLSATPSVVVSQGLDVVLELNGKSHIRTKYNNIVSSIQIKDVVNNRELRGFWIRWLDDQLVEVGRDTDNSPILVYRVPEKLSVNFIAILSFNSSAEWILHEDPHCGAYNITKKIKVETKCKVGTTKINSEKINFLQNSQQHILHQIKNQHGISKVNSLRTKEILLDYQESIKRLYRNAEENQNQIYAEDTEIYSPLKSITFDQITEEYWQFMAEVQKELANFKQTTTDINSGNTSLELHCSILEN